MFCKSDFVKLLIYLPLALISSGFSAPLFAQCRLGGRVTDEAMRPLAGANVYINGLALGAATDADGYYQIAEVPVGKHPLRVTYIGYQPEMRELSVTNASANCTLDIQLTEQAYTADELVVYATRADARTPMTYTNVDREELAKNNLGQDVPYLLQWTPSVVVTSDAGAGIGYTGIWIRGVDPTRTNVTINGIPLNDAESQGVFWVDLPDIAASTEDIQIQRGVGTSTNGAGAFGATINLNTSQVHRDPYASIEGGLGSFNTSRGGLRFGTGLLKNRFTVDGRLSRIRSDGYIDRASADLDSWFLSGAYVGDRGLLRFNAFSGHEVTYQAWNGVPADYVDDPELRTYNSAGTEKEGEPYDNEVDDYRQTHFQLLFNRQLGTAWHLNLAGHYTIGAGFYEQYKNAQRLADYGLAPVAGIDTTDLIRRRWLDNDFYGTTYSLVYQRPDDRLQATLGGGYHIYEGRHFGEIIWARLAGTSEIRESYYDNDARKTDGNVFLKVNYALLGELRTYLDLQFRRVTYDFLGIDNDLSPIDGRDELTFFNPKAGLWYPLGARTVTYASFGVAQREPNRNDYVDNPPRQRPRPEKLYNTEVGLRYQGGKASLGANVYHMYYRDQLVLNGQLNDVGEYQRVNVDKSYRLGLELVGDWRITPALSLYATTTLSRNKVIGFTEYVDEYDPDFNWLGQRPVDRRETDLAFSPSVTANAELTYHLPANNGENGLEVSLLSKYVGKRYLDNSSDDNNVLDPYYLQDLRLRYSWQPAFAESIRLTLLVQNLFNKQYEANGWSYRYFHDEKTFVDRGLYPQAGRNFLLGLGISF